MKDNYLVQAWLVLGLALLFAVALAGVQVGLAEKIRDNKLNETMSQIPSLVPEATGGVRTEIDGRTVYRATDADGAHVGWVVPASGQGFADQIEVLIGLDAEAETITGLYVLAHKETPGVGNRITDSSFLEQFAGKWTVRPVAVRKTRPLGANGILAISGATVSSMSVAKIVNIAIAELRDKLADAADDDEDRGRHGTQTRRRTRRRGGRRDSAVEHGRDEPAESDIQN